MDQITIGSARNPEQRLEGCLGGDLDPREPWQKVGV